MKILVTGAAGFLGSWIAEALLYEGHEVFGIDDLSGGSLDNVGNYEFGIANILDLDLLYKAAYKCDTIYHCAALAYEGLSVFSPSLITENIVVGSTNVMVAAVKAGVSRVINCSSMARYGSGFPPFAEWHPPEPVDPYGRAKLFAEQQMNTLGAMHGVHVIHAVPHNIVGTRQKFDDPYRNVLSIMVNRILQGKAPVVYGDGNQMRCFSDVRDVVPVMMQLLTAQTGHGEVFNVGPDEDPVSINALVDLVGLVMDTKLTPLYVDARPFEVKHAYCSSDKIRQRFGYETTKTLVDSVYDVVKYIKDKGPRPFDYRLPIELDTDKLPRMWKERLM